MQPAFILMLVVSTFLYCRDISDQRQKNNTAHEPMVSEPLTTRLDSTNFESLPNTMLPMAQASKNLVGSEYSVRFSQEMIVSDLPYYGVAHRGKGVGRDKGMRFQGRPTDFSVQDSEKGYQINASVKTDDDRFDISMHVSKSGYATLTIESKNRESISYDGEVK